MGVRRSINKTKALKQFRTSIIASRVEDMTESPESQYPINPIAVNGTSNLTLIIQCSR